MMMTIIIDQKDPESDLATGRAGTALAPELAVALVAVAGRDPAAAVAAALGSTAATPQA